MSQDNITLTSFIFMSLQSFFSERFYTIADKKNTGSVHLEYILEGLQLLANGDCFLKLSFLYDAYDVDGKYKCI